MVSPVVGQSTRSVLPARLGGVFRAVGIGRRELASGLAAPGAIFAERRPEVFLETLCAAASLVLADCERMEARLAGIHSSAMHGMIAIAVAAARSIDLVRPAGVHFDDSVSR